MHSIDCVCLFAFLGVVNIANAAPAIDINQNPVEPSTELHAIIDADPGSNSLNQHLASIMKFDAPLEPPGIVKLDTPLEAPPEMSDALNMIPNDTDTKDPSENPDLQQDASGYYGYGGYRPPYYNYYRPSYSNYWSYGNQYQRPYYQYYPPNYGYYGYRPNNYYGSYYSPYRRPFSSYYY